MTVCIMLLRLIIPRWIMVRKLNKSKEYQLFAEILAECVEKQDYQEAYNTARLLHQCADEIGCRVFRTFLRWVHRFYRVALLISLGTGLYLAWHGYTLFKAAAGAGWLILALHLATDFWSDQVCEHMKVTYNQRADRFVEKHLSRYGIALQYKEPTTEQMLEGCNTGQAEKRP